MSDRPYMHPDNCQCGDCDYVEPGIHVSDKTTHSETRTKNIFVPHIGTVTINSRGAVEFTANVHTPVGLVVRKGEEGKVIVHADTINELNRGVREALIELGISPEDLPPLT